MIMSAVDIDKVVPPEHETDNKETEDKPEICDAEMSPKTINMIRSLKEQLNETKTKFSKKITEVKKKTRKEIVEQISNNHTKLLEKERENHKMVLDGTRDAYEVRLNEVQNFYVGRVNKMEEVSNEIYTTLIKAKEAVEDHHQKNKDHLEYLNNLIQKFPRHDSTTKISSLKSDVDVWDNNNENKKIKSSEIISLENKITDLNKKLEESQTKLNQKDILLKQETASKNQIKEKLKYVELMYQTTSNEKDELIKQLKEQIQILKTDNEDMQRRHNEHFQKYDRMLRKANEEIAVQKREVLALRTQFVPGTPPLNHPTNVGIPSCKTRVALDINGRPRRLRRRSLLKSPFEK